ncbi:MAG: 50S ribosomal protein L13, partial [Pyrinomonadaceae bacterium]
MDMGDHVIVINARKAVLKGSKIDQKVYRHHTLYPGGLREISARNMFAKHPERVIELAIKGMLPKTKLGKAMGKKLKIYPDADHPHTAQRPQPHQLTAKSNQNKKTD